MIAEPEIQLKAATSEAWINAVLLDFDSFLIDHADCERKASAMAMSLIYKVPNRTAIIPELIETALEEMVHFKQVYAHMERRGLQIPLKNQKDPYISALNKHIRSSSDARFLDRLLLASIIETRGAERFNLIAKHIDDTELKAFYTMLYNSEKKHGTIFINMAKHYYDEEIIARRLADLLLAEAEIIKQLPIRSALH